MDGLSIQITPPADGKAMEVAGTTEKFTADLSLVDDPKSKEAIEALGYQNISGIWDSAHLAAERWQAGIVEIRHLGRECRHVRHRPSISVATRSTSSSRCRKCRRKMAAQPEGADKSSEGMAMLGLLQQLSFNSASIRFDDDSLTKQSARICRQAAGHVGQGHRHQAKAIVPFGMAQLNNPELTAEVTAAVTKYLDDPKSLEISAEPSAAVPFALIMAVRCPTRSTCRRRSASMSRPTKTDRAKARQAKARQR